MNKPFNNLDEQDYFFDVNNRTDNVASATECTGLMPIPPEDDDESESYNQIYIIPKQNKNE